MHAYLSLQGFDTHIALSMGFDGESGSHAAAFAIKAHAEGDVGVKALQG